MHEKAGEKIKLALRYAVIVVLSAQIMMGLAWGFKNFSLLQPFPDTADLVGLSGTLKLTGDTGILYPAFLLLVRALTVNGPVKFYHVMYLLQIVLGFAAWFVFAKNVFKFSSKDKNIFFALAVITNPYAMQVHLAVLEYSFISSFAALLISFQIRFTREWKEAEKCPGLEKALRDISVTSLFWLASALTRKEFFIIGLIPVAALLIAILKRFMTGKAKPAFFIWPTAVALAFAGIICMGDSLFREGEKLSVIDSVKRDLYYRVAWGEDFRDRYHWPEYLTDKVDESMMTHIMNDPGLVRTDFTDYMTSRYGSNETTRLFAEWAGISFSGNKKHIIKETVSDMAGYVFAPARTEMILSGSEYPGYAAGNYDVMKQAAPKLTKIYLGFFSVMYCVLAAASLAALIFGKGLKRKAFYFIPAALMALGCAAYYSMQGSNVFDHRKVVFTTCLWIALMMGGL